MKLYETATLALVGLFAFSGVASASDLALLLLLAYGAARYLPGG